MIKRVSILIATMCFLGGFSYGQNIVAISEFKPYERVGDTIYFNRNNYEFVVSNEKGYYGTWDYVTLFSLLQLSDLRNKTGISPYTIKFKNKHISTMPADFYGELTSVYGWGVDEPAQLKDFKIKKNNIAYYAEENDLLFPEIPRDTSIPPIYVPFEFFPDLEPVLKEFYQYLNFENGQVYTIRFNWDGAMDLVVDVPYLCNPIIKGTGPRFNDMELKRILDSMLVNFNWPVLKVENRILPYTTVKTDMNLREYVGIQLEKMKNNKKFRPLFTSSDSVLTLVDSLNYQTTVFIPGQQNAKDPAAYSITIPGIINYAKPLADINNDGMDDYILDSAEAGVYIGAPNSINYIPFYSKTSKYQYLISQSVEFTEDLGNHYYFLAENIDEASIFYIKNNEIIDVISITRDTYDKKGKDRNKYFFHFLVYKSPELTATFEANSKKAYYFQKMLEEMIKHYVKEPEKLSIDFPMK